MTRRSAYSASFITAFVAGRQKQGIKTSVLHRLGLWISIWMGWHCPQLLSMITRQPTPEEQKLLDETETFVKNEIADVTKVIAADYIANGPPDSGDTLNDIRERRDRAVAAFAQYVKPPPFERPQDDQR